MDRALIERVSRRPGSDLARQFRIPHSTLRTWAGGKGEVKVAVVGGGAWGTALADLLARKGGVETVTLWAREPEVVESVNREHLNHMFLPGAALAPSLRAHQDAGEAVSGAGVILSAAPGWEFADLGGRHHAGGGSHGSLTAGDSEVPMLTVGLGPPPDSITGVAPAILAHLGVPLPAYVRSVGPVR